MHVNVNVVLVVILKPKEQRRELKAKTLLGQKQMLVYKILYGYTPN